MKLTSGNFAPSASGSEPSATSLPGSAVGPMLSDSLAGPTTGRSGRHPVHVSRFRARGNDKAMPTSATCGPLFMRSSPSAGLQSSLESRLRARMDVNGSPEYVLTWKTWDMPAGLPICALRALRRRTSGKGFSGWRSPQSRDGERGMEHFEATLQILHPRLNLATQVQLASWATPTCCDWKDSEGMATKARNPDGSRRTRLNTRWPRQAIGMQANPSIAATENGGEFRLNPGFSLWLMGYPIEWTCCGARVTRSVRRSPRNSSEP